ncbi:NitT/TauT family transport system substrate-binding protein [Thermocatellispora tengchongensis]|uniref:NitT/TauT family transport system substrate-binding protein n=1 Tax=Thermocatellispora tengchongensis TaxID=1073253 RepID=A0A840PFY9_9ACTN|nr:ABC transporter substrate-binding protein [Thermocatellispora tengchongensis]MBB5134955.1 NitT/TauT family transport system substrate-binding protein [Thermocatellispora tengchongensis]
MNRRSLRFRALAAVIGMLAGATLAGCGSGSGSGSEDLKQVTIAFGNPAFSLTVVEAYLPLAREWWREEGYDVTVVPNQGSQAATQVLIGGRAQFVIGNTAPGLAAAARGDADIQLVAATANNQWSLVAPEGGGITRPEQLRGKKIGVAVAGSGGAVYLDQLLRDAGLDPEKDVEQVVVGFGAAAYEALSSGRVQAFFSFAADIDNQIAQGARYTFMYDEQWRRFPDYGLLTTKQVVDVYPEMVEAIARGVAKSMAFLEASPECAAKVFRAGYAGSGGGGLTPEQEVTAMKLSLEDRVQTLKSTGGDDWGAVRLDGLAAMQEFLKAQGQLDTPAPVSRLLPEIDGLAAKANDFDRDALRAEARACAA